METETTAQFPDETKGVKQQINAGKYTETVLKYAFNTAPENEGARLLHLPSPATNSLQQCRKLTESQGGRKRERQITWFKEIYILNLQWQSLPVGVSSSVLHQATVHILKKGRRLTPTRET